MFHSSQLWKKLTIISLLSHVYLAESIPAPSPRSNLPQTNLHTKHPPSMALQRSTSVRKAVDTVVASYQGIVTRRRTVSLRKTFSLRRRHGLPRSSDRDQDDKDRLPLIPEEQQDPVKRKLEAERRRREEEERAVALCDPFYGGVVC